MLLLGEAKAIVQQQVGLGGEQALAGSKVRLCVRAGAFAAQYGGKHGVGGRVSRLEREDTLEQRLGGRVSSREAQLRRALKRGERVRAQREGMVKGLERVRSAVKRGKGNAFQGQQPAVAGKAPKLRLRLSQGSGGILGAQLRDDGAEVRPSSR